MGRAPISILLLDDDDVDRMNVIRALKTAGIDADVTEFMDSETALVALHSRSFDCAFFDYHLPGGDGLALLHEVRAANIDTPIIVLTGQGDEQLAVDMLRAGATDYLPKGKLSPTVLGSSLRGALRIHAAELQQRQTEQALRKSNEKIIKILESISDAFFAVDSTWRFTYVNRQAETLMQEARETLLGHTIWEKLPDVSRCLKDKLCIAMDSRVTATAEAYYAPLDRWLEIHAYPSEEGLSVYLQDISDRKKAEQRLNHMATHDELTGLANRMMLMDHLNQTLTRLPWNKRIVAVLFLDLDGFKRINDTLGHSVGDRLLCAVAKRLDECVCPVDTVARLGGDEFVIVLHEITQARDIEIAAEKIRSALSQAYHLNGHEILITPSIGSSMFPNDGKDADTLIKNADIAMYRAKAQGKNNFQHYTPARHNKAGGQL